MSKQVAKKTSAPKKLSQNEKQKKQAEKVKLLTEVKKVLKKTKLPPEIVLEKWAKITDPEKFFTTHLAIVERHDGLPIKPYSERLKKALKLVGIDLKAIAEKLAPKDKQPAK